jgi:hypothetical protein
MFGITKDGRKQLRCCASDGGRPTEFGVQALISNQPVLLQPKAVVVSNGCDGVPLKGLR